MDPSEISFKIPPWILGFLQRLNRLTEFLQMSHSYVLLGFRMKYSSQFSTKVSPRIFTQISTEISLGILVEIPVNISFRGSTWHLSGHICWYSSKESTRNFFNDFLFSRIVFQFFFSGIPSVTPPGLLMEFIPDFFSGLIRLFFLWISPETPPSFILGFFRSASWYTFRYF